LRRVTPTLITFLVLLAIALWLRLPVPIATIILVIAYVSLCGMLLTSVFDVVISLFSGGHRGTAVGILHRVALKPLFAIGSLVALGDAVDSQQIYQLIGIQLSNDLAVLANTLAGLIAFWLIFKIRRPV